MTPPGDLVLGQAWPLPVLAPILGPAWLARPFRLQVEEVVDWLRETPLAVGHSFGAWLLLCGAEEMLQRSKDTPRLVLLAPVLGAGRHPGSAMGYFAPRTRRIQAALRLRQTEGDVQLPTNRLSFVHGLEDPQCPLDLARRLAAAGYRVELVPGGHRLEDSRAQRVVARLLHEYRHYLKR